MFQALAQVKLSILDEKDYQLLSKREIKLNSDTIETYLSELIEYIRKLPAHTICLFPTKEQCSKLNVGMLKKIRSEKILITAEDLIEAKTAIQKAKPAKSLEKLKKKGKVFRNS